MNILWLTNGALPEASILMNEKVIPFGGWFVSVADILAEQDEIKLSIAFPKSGLKDLVILNGANIKFYAFPPVNDISANNENTFLKKILDEANPDILHVFGTEYPHSFEVLRYADVNKCVINIQGLLTIIAKHFSATLPLKILKSYTLRDFVKGQNLIKQITNFEKQGKLETQVLKIAKHVIGRTTWDYACVKQINPNLNYHFCNEILRKEFYHHQWDITKCERFAIFTSQGNYPYKGLHNILEAMPLILRRFPATKLYVSGYDIFSNKNFWRKLKVSSYAKYINKLINKYNLRGKVIFTDLLDEKEMCEQMLKSHVFISASTVENESNSLSEAKILGVPCVASYVGGVVDRIKHGEDGFFYQHDATYMLAYYVCKIFEDDGLAMKLSQNARQNALKVNDITNNINNLLDIYNEINNTSKED